MSGLVTTKQQNAIVTFTVEQIDLMKRTIAKGATDDELKLFLYQCQRTGLDPLSKQIYFSKYRSKNGEDRVSILTAIDGYRLIADRTGKYAGNDDPIFDNDKAPQKATATVYKLVGGIRCPFTSTARWLEYYPGEHKGFMWKQMPCLMLGKCAEALALRKAFPNELSGVYVKEEMEQAESSSPVLYTPQEKDENGHKKLLKKIAEGFGVKDRAELAELSGVCNGTELNNLSVFIEQYLKESGFFEH